MPPHTPTLERLLNLQVPQWELSQTGLLFDRMWSVVDSNRRGLTQKRCADLRRIKPSIDLVKRQLILCAEGSLMFSKMPNTTALYAKCC